MSHNPDVPAPGAAAAFQPLSGHGVLRIEGRDASAFAQAQFMNDVAGLAPGHWQWNGWLTPKGRLVALFALLKLDQDQLWLWLPDVAPAALAAALRRFVFRSKLTLAEDPALQVSGALSASRWASAAHVVGDEEHGLELDLSGDGGGRALRIGGPRTEARADPRFAADWAALDLHHGLPRLPPSQAEAWTPQHLSLERLHAYSVRKGCYPGQEIVARTHFLGQARRGLALFEADGDVPVAADVEAAGRVVGTIASAVQRDGRTLLLAVLPPAQEGALQAAGMALHPLPLADGLAR